MSHRTIRWRTCIGLGSLLGMVAAGADLIPRPRAEETASAIRSIGSTGPGPCGGGATPSCCSDATNKGRLLTLASAASRAAAKPKIDRIAGDGTLLTDLRGRLSRAAFILGRSPFRTGLSRMLRGFLATMSVVKRLRSIEVVSPPHPL